MQQVNCVPFVASASQLIRPYPSHTLNFSCNVTAASADEDEPKFYRRSSAILFGRSQADKKPPTETPNKPLKLTIKSNAGREAKKNKNAAKKKKKGKKES